MLGRRALRHAPCRLRRHSRAWAGSVSEAQGRVTVALPVTKLPVEFAVTETEAERIPRTLNAAIPAAWQGAVGAYWAGLLFIGPVGWSGKGVFGADGSGGVTLYPDHGLATQVLNYFLSATLSQLARLGLVRTGRSEVAVTRRRITDWLAAQSSR